MNFLRFLYNVVYLKTHLQLNSLPLPQNIHYIRPFLSVKNREDYHRNCSSRCKERDKKKEIKRKRIKTTNKKVEVLITASVKLVGFCFQSINLFIVSCIDY